MSVVAVLCSATIWMGAAAGWADGGGYDEARSLLEKKRWSEAAIVLKRVLRDRPDLSPASLDLARALVYSDRREEALSVLGQAANRERGTKRAAIIRRSRVLSCLFLTNETFQVYEDALHLLSSGRYRAAQERFEKALEKEPDNVEILVRTGQALVLDSDFDSAAERLRLARKLNPHEPQVRLWLGRALHQRGEVPEAIEELKSAQRELEASEAAPLWLAEALWSSGQKAAALRVLEDDVRVKPFHLPSLVGLARLGLQMAGKDRTALWGVRRNLQVALSRFDGYSSQKNPHPDGELGLSIRNAQKLKEEIDSLLRRVEERLAGGPESDAT